MVRPLLVEHGIVSWPSLVSSMSCEPATDKEGNRAKQFRHEATYDFTFANIEDPKDCLVIRIIGHAMDNADKAPGKALSYAKKYAVLKLFDIETGEDDESRYNPEGVENDLLTGYITELTEAADMDTLKAKFAVVYKATTAANDKDAQKAVTKAYNARKVTLTGAAK
jgi:hypothetical protein